MAADQRKRRPSSTMGPFGCGVQEQYRAKKREFRPFQFEVNCNSHVSLMWDDNEKMVVAKEEQIGISSRHLAAFSPVGNAKLADVVAVPKEVFELDDLAEVLTYEGWESLLTDKDRTFLSQFLPEGFESDEIVQALLGCENFHFGNPFLKWSSSLCLGNLHPDAVVRNEKSFKANKKAYYSELQQYHENMITNLHKLKERCGSAKDPESEIMKLMSRSKGHAEKIVLPDSNGFSLQKFEANATYESASSIADDKSYYSDNQKLSVIRDAEIQRRIRNQELIKDKHEKLSSSPNNGLKGLPRPKKVEKSQKASVISNDGTKYMSYVKISKKQHEELVLSMGQSGPVIQPKNLNRLLGNLDSYNVKPYVMFEQEEQKRIHEHWISLVNKDLPATLEKWRRVQLERLQIVGYLCQEIEDKVPLLTETQDEKLVKPSGNEIAKAQNIENCHGIKFGIQGSVSDSDEPTRSSSSNETSKQSLPLNIDPECDPPSLSNQLNVNDKFVPSSTNNQSLRNSLLNMNKEFDPSSKRNQYLPDSPLNVKEEFGVSSMEKKSSTGKNQELDPMDLNSEINQVSSETRAICSASEEHDGQTFAVSLGIPHTKTHSSVNNMWSSTGLPESSMGSTPFASSSEPTAGLPQLVTEDPPIDRGVFSMEKESSTKNQEFDPMDLNSENNQVSSETRETCSPSEEHVGQTSAVSLGISHTKTHSSVNMWSSVGLPESIMGSTPFASSTELAAGLPRLVTEEPPVDLEVFSMGNKSSSTAKSQELDPMDLNSENNQVSSETRAICSASEEHAGETSAVPLGISHTKTHSLVNTWSSLGLLEPSMGSTPFASSSELTAGIPRLVTQQPPIDLGVFSMENKSSSTKNQEFDPMDVNSENNQVSSETRETCSSEQHVGQTSAVSLGVPPTKIHSSVNNLWSSMRLPESYGLSHPHTPFASSSELTVGLPRLVPEQPAHLINLGHDLPGGHTKDLLNRHTNHMPFIDSLANKERNESLLPSLILRDSFHQEQKKAGPVFHPGNVLLEPNQFPSHTRGELFMNPTIQDSVYSDNSRYCFQGPEHFSSLNPRDWANARGSTQMQPQVSSGGQLQHNWFVNDNRATHSHGSWSAPEVPVFSTAGLGSGSGDQSLYSVLSQCNSLQPRNQYNPVGSIEPVMIHSTSYGQGMGMANPGIPMSSNPVRPTSPFDYLSGGEATGPALKNPMGWMSLGNPPSSLQDPSGKPFRKTWNP
ncbi:hypothetical protein KSS87_005572 [Heliosperma pusillum]|nr:hypothetical protein KSS87_005572 [Heliosperma pusillum]